MVVGTEVEFLKMAGMTLPLHILQIMLREIVLKKCCCIGTSQNAHNLLKQYVGGS